MCDEDEAQRFFFDLEAARPDHRVRALCRQAQEAVWMAMAEMDLDVRLEQTFVASVDPAPGPERLLVTVVLPAAAPVTAVEAAFAALAEIKGELRAAVARAIHRKRVPDLAFRVVRDGGAHEG